MAKILVIDDSRFAQNTIKHILGVEHTYIEAYDGFMGVELFMREKPDLVILDLTMPGIHGLRVLRDLHRMSPDVVVVVATADVQEATRKEALEKGAFDVITKPFDPQEMRQVVARALESRGARDD